jgi:hypothetical protein
MTVKIDGIAGLTFADNSTQNVTALNASNITAGTLGRTRLPTGSVIQTINNYVSNSPNIATTSLTSVASGISASITPTSASNLICIEFSSSMTDPASAGIVARMYVNGSAMPSTSDYHIAYRDTNVRYAPSIFLGTFQPSNTSTLTFEVYIRSLNGNAGRIAHGDSSYCLKLTEIVA